MHDQSNPSERVFVIAEAGVNHDGKVDLAHQLVDVAADAGADAVKFQTFVPQLLLSPTARTAAYQVAAGEGALQMAMLERLTLPAGAWPELAEHARERGLMFMSTPFDAPSLEMLVGLGVALLKIPSGEVTNLPWLRRLARCEVPLILSTGMSDLAEVDAAIEALAGATSVELLHCVSAYPAPIADANLRAIPVMRQKFNLPVGWSDHTVGSTSAVVAAALGARTFEKHMTTDRRRSGPDHAASADAAGLRRYVTEVRLAVSSLGTGTKEPQPSEIEVRAAARRSWHALRDMRAGDRIGPDDLVPLRPGHGLAPSVDPVGRILARDLAAGQIVEVADVRDTQGLS